MFECDEIDCSRSATVRLVIIVPDAEGDDCLHVQMHTVRVCDKHASEIQEYTPRECQSWPQLRAMLSQAAAAAQASDAAVLDEARFTFAPLTPAPHARH